MMGLYYIVVNDSEIEFEAEDLKEAQIIAADCGANPNYVFERKNK